MKTQLHVCVLVLFAGLLCPTLAQNTRQPSSSNDKAKADVAEARSVGSLTTPALNVTVTAEAWSGDFVSYKSGDNFIVIVPQAKTDAIKWNLSGQGLSGVQVEQRGEDVVVTLRVNSANKPSVRQDGNRFEISFGAITTAAPKSNVVSVVNESPRTASVPDAGNGSVSAQPPAVAPPVAGSAAPQNLAAIVGPLLQNNTPADALNLDLSVPESPAFAVLGFTPQTVLRPATPQQFASSLLNGLDQNGNFQNGIAIETAPYMLFNGENVTIRDYMTQRVTRLLARTQFSFALTKGASSDDLSRRVAAGLNIALWDRGDPRIYRPGEEGDVLDCFVRVLDFDRPIPPSIDPDNKEEVMNFVAPELNRLKILADECRAEGAKAQWNRSAWTIAYAPSWISKSGQGSDFKWNGGAFWTSLAYGFEEFPSLRKTSQVILHARYRSREQVADEENPGQFLTQNTFFFGGRFRAGSPKFALNFEDAFLRTKTLGGGIDTSNRFSIGTELRLTDNLYFVISAGGNAARSDGQSKGFVLTSFKYGFNKQPQVNTRP